jgi:phosphoglycerate kinase
MNTFYKEAGFVIGKSVTEEGFSKQIKPLLSNPAILLPVDCLVIRKKTASAKATASQAVTVTADEVEHNDVIVDIGPQSVALITEKIMKAKLVVWNGPTGWYEKGFVKATTTLAKACVASKAHTIIGGGDTGAVVEKIIKNNDSKKLFVSTGGGATLEYLASGTLPGIIALK